MSVNPSASSNSSLLSSINFFSSFNCSFFHINAIVYTTFTVINIIFLLPLCLLVLYHGLQRWWKHCFNSTAATPSHSDSFTYHIVTMEVISISGTIVFCCGVYMNNTQTLGLGSYFISINWYGEMFFHLLTCVEHYLAVVHPITYLSLRNERWIRIRNIITGFIWLLCFALTGISVTTPISYLDFGILMCFFIIISFCSLSVLCGLIRTDPHRQGRVDQSKQRAFYTIIAILGVLWLRCGSNVILGILYVVSNGNFNECMWNMYEIWLNLPSSLVLPLLFLQRTGTLGCCKNNIK